MSTLILPGLPELAAPRVRVEHQIQPALSRQLEAAGLDELRTVEVWNVDSHSRALAYATHGVARYFGKFPPPIARHILETYTTDHQRVLDPMCGSGTSVVEGILTDRDVVGFDLNPIAVTIAEAKTTKLHCETIGRILEQINSTISRVKPVVPEPVSELRNPSHWFRPDTMDGLGRINRAVEIACRAYPEAAAILWASFSAIIRNCSNATNQQGRIFLDINSAIADPIPLFKKKLAANLTAACDLPRSAMTRPTVADARECFDSKLFDAAIVHPPYFNSYKYSSVYSFEMAWLGVSRKDIAKNEVREGFKQGKHARVDHYIEDILTILRSTKSAVKKGGIIGLMLGDTILCGKYVQVAREVLLSATEMQLELQLLAVRPPRYTEASWVASQRRTTSSLGANIADYVLLFRNA